MQPCQDTARRPWSPPGVSCSAFAASCWSNLSLGALVHQPAAHPNVIAWHGVMFAENNKLTDAINSQATEPAPWPDGFTPEPFGPTFLYRYQDVYFEDVDNINTGGLFREIIDYSDGAESVDPSKWRLCCFECDCCAAYLCPFMCPIWMIFSTLFFPCFAWEHCRCRIKGSWAACNCCLVRASKIRKDELTKKNLERLDKYLKGQKETQENSEYSTSTRPYLW